MVSPITVLLKYLKVSSSDLYSDDTSDSVRDPPIGRPETIIVGGWGGGGGVGGGGGIYGGGGGGGGDGGWASCRDV